MKNTVLTFLWSLLKLDIRELRSSLRYFQLFSVYNKGNISNQKPRNFWVAKTLMSLYILRKFWVFQRELLRNYPSGSNFRGNWNKWNCYSLPFERLYFHQVMISIYVPRVLATGFFSRATRSFVGRRQKTRVGHFLILDRNRKPRMKSLWHPG